jgi:hypothetical protein
MGEHGNRRAERANKYLKRGGAERIRRLSERAQQISDYLRIRQTRQLRPSCERGLYAFED